MENIYEIDVPIKNSEKDELNRSKFVEILYNSIINYGKKENECLVIGLMGEWGCGKTSIINMVYEKIDAFNEKQPSGKQWINIKFNPWYFSNQNSILYHFLDFLMAEFNKTDPINKIFVDLSELKDKLSNFSFNASFMGTGFGVSYDNPDTDSNIYKSFNSLKRELMELFNDLKYKIVISIDDVDRLSDSEIQQIFLLVKALADFPNVIYILSFDKNVALKALTNLQVYSPEKFLEKIIQIPILVPEITQSRLDLLVEEKIKPIYQDNNKLEYSNFVELFIFLRPFFNNLRDLKRYVNVLNFYLNQFKDEINIFDFMLIIAIQLFEYEIYKNLRINKDYLVGYSLVDSLDSNDKLKIYNDLMNVLNSPKNYNKNRMESLLLKLFPIINSLKYDKSYDEEIFNIDLNICSKIHFDKYFTFSIEENEASQILIDTFFELYDVNQVTEFLLKIIDGNKSKSFFNKIQTNLYKFYGKNNSYYIESLLKLGDKTDCIPEISYILDSLFGSSEYDFYNILKYSVNNSESFYTCCYFIHEIGFKYGLYHGDVSKSQNVSYFSLDQFKELKNDAYNRIIAWSKNGSLVKNKRFIGFLDFWIRWGTKEEVQSFIISDLSDSIFLEFLENFKIEELVKEYEEDVSIIKVNFDFNKLSSYCDVEKIHQRVNLIFSENNLSDEYYALCEVFLGLFDDY